MNFLSLFGYINLAAGVSIAVSGIRAIYRSGKKTSGPELIATVQPALTALSGVLPNTTIPMQLEQDIAAAVAAVLNQWHTAHTAVETK